MLLVLLMTVVAEPIRADELVTIPKSRLEELERKAAELEKWKKEANRLQSEKEQLEDAQRRLNRKAAELQKARAAAESKASAVAAAAGIEPILEHNTPPIATLPPLQKGEVVDAMDLMNHYRADPSAARKRYEAKRIQVQGEVTGFEKPLFVRPYLVHLRTTDRAWKVACTIHPPESYAAVFTAKRGDEMVGSTTSGTRSTIVRVGQKVVIEGRCNGLRDQAISFTGCTLQFLW